MFAALANFVDVHSAGIGLALLRSVVAPAAAPDPGPPLVATQADAEPKGPSGPYRSAIARPLEELLDELLVELLVELPPLSDCPLLVHSVGPTQLWLFSQPQPVLWLQQAGMVWPYQAHVPQLCA